MNPSLAAYGLSSPAIKRFEDWLFDRDDVPEDMLVLAVLVCAAAEAQVRGPILSPN